MKTYESYTNKFIGVELWTSSICLLKKINIVL